MIDLRQMRHVLALAEHRNFARAAEALHITQPALTRSIQGVEASLGALLFDRGRRDVAPTAIGELVLAHAGGLELAARDLERDVQLALGMEVGQLRIGAGSFAGTTLIGNALAKLTLAHPRLRTHVIQAPWLELPERLRQRDIELMVGDMSEVEAIDEFEVRLLKPQPYMPVARAGHPLAHRASLVTSDVLDYPLIGPGLTKAMETAIVRNLKLSDSRAGREKPLLTVVCDSLPVLRTLLLKTDAVAVLSPFMVADDLAARLLVAMKSLTMDAQSRYGIAHLKGRTLSAPARAFRDFLLSEQPSNVATAKQ
ncbi:LysR family transcriptional regulator [Comamonas aquatilis]|uniref:LysR family transcriptional regulator n=1 Tax=Comamonas aquatilis TaxID=1778406 RepID=UPI0039F05841